MRQRATPVVMAERIQMSIIRGLKDGADVEVVYPDQNGDGTLVMPTAVVIEEER